MASARIPLDDPSIPVDTTGAGSKLAHSAFWLMARRVTLVAAGIDFAYLLLFLALDSPFLAWLNVVSMAMYAIAYWLLKQRINRPALILIWLEVLGHAALGSLLVGWNSGFHYFLLMFIPAVVVSGRMRLVVLLIVLLLAFYLGLNAVSNATGALTPLNSGGLWVVHTFNVSIVFVMAAYTSRFYYITVRRAERALVELATKDSLTGLSNRRSLLSRASLEIARARRSGEPIALIIADLDHFKKINDRHGHEGGDQVLAQVGALLLSISREQDVVARWGGEEFLLLLPATSIEQATAIAERIREAIAATVVEHGSTRIKLSVSGGVTEFSASEALGVAIARADRAMYRSKTDGRNKVTVSEPATAAPREGEA